MSTTLDTPASAEVPRGSPRPRGVSVPWRVLKALGSLQLTVVLFAFAMVLVFLGTLAQLEKGIWTVVEQYFWSSYVWVPFQLLAEFGKRFFDFPQDTTWGGSFPFPGGKLLGIVMMVNLLAAHVTRFKLSWRRAGIITIHLGVILLMVGEAITREYAIESRMVLQVGEGAAFLDNARKVELAFVEQGTGKTARTVTVPQSMLKPGEKVTDAELPVDIEVLEFMKNSKLVPHVGGDDTDAVVRVDGLRMKIVPADEHPGVGVDSEGEDAAVTRVRLLKKGTNEVVAERQISVWQYGNFYKRLFLSTPILIAVGDKKYEVQLRQERILKPYTVELLAFEHKVFAGTPTPKDFASTVRLVDAETGDDRQIRIWMNHPLRHRGETFYQQAVTYGDTGTVLQVVRNPGWILPYVACCVVTLGMLVHFGINMRKFVNRRPPA